MHAGRAGDFGAPGFLFLEPGSGYGGGGGGVDVEGGVSRAPDAALPRAWVTGTRRSWPRRRGGVRARAPPPRAGARAPGTPRARRIEPAPPPRASVSPPSKIAAAFDIASAETSTALPFPVEHRRRRELRSLAAVENRRRLRHRLRRNLHGLAAPRGEHRRRRELRSLAAVENRRRLRHRLRRNLHGLAVPRGEHRRRRELRSLAAVENRRRLRHRLRRNLHGLAARRGERPEPAQGRGRSLRLRRAVVQKPRRRRFPGGVVEAAAAGKPAETPDFGVFGSFGSALPPFEGGPRGARSTAIAAGEGTASGSPEDPPWNANPDANGSRASSTANVSGTLTVSGTAAAFPASSPATEHGSSCSNAPPPSVRLGRSTSASASAAVRVVTPPRVGIATGSRAVRLPTTTLRGAPKRRRAPVRRRRVRVRVGERKRRQRRAPGMRDTRCFVVSPARRRRRGGRRGRGVRERVPAPRRRARRSGPARVHQRSAHPLCRSAALLPPVEVREVRVVVHLVVVHHRRRQNGLPCAPNRPHRPRRGAAGETPRERSPRRRSRRRRPRDGLGRGENTPSSVRRGSVYGVVCCVGLGFTVGVFQGVFAASPASRLLCRERVEAAGVAAASDGPGDARGGARLEDPQFPLSSSLSLRLPLRTASREQTPRPHPEGHPEGWRARRGARPRTPRSSAALRGFPPPSSPPAPGASTSPNTGTPSQARAPSRRRARRARPGFSRRPGRAQFPRREPRATPACRLAEPAFRRATPRHLGDAAYPEARGGARRSPRRARWRRARGETRGRAACAAEPRGPRAACHWTSGGHTRAQRQPARRTRRSRRR